MNGKFEIEQVRTEDGLAGLWRPWRSMLAETEHVSVFQTWEWLSDWWHHRQGEPQLWLLLVWDGERQLAGAAPLMLVEDGEGLLRIRRLVFLGSGYRTRCHHDFPARDRDRKAVAQAALDYLARRRREWDLLDLEGVAEWSVVEPYLRRMPGHFLSRGTVRSRYICLPPSYEVYELECLGAARSEELRVLRQRLERDYPGQVLFERLTATEDLARALEALQAFEGIPEDQCVANFSRAFADDALHNGWLRLDRLRAAGQTIAVELGFLYRGVWSSYRSGIDRDWERYYPGDLLHAHVIRQAIEEGARELDAFHGPAGSRYPWENGEHYDAHLVLSTSVQGDARMWWDAAHDALRALGHGRAGVRS